MKALIQTSDGGSLIGGVSDSGISGDKSQSSQGSGDFWVVKLNVNGVKQWDKSFGGNNGDGISCLQQTSDGGFILGGSSFSGISGDKTESSRGMNDYWIIKTDSNGNKIWDKTFDASATEILKVLEQTFDGGYILGGTSNSNNSGDKTEPNKGSGRDDFWIVKIDNIGNKQWDKTFGGNHEDNFYSLKQTADSGYLLGGLSESGISGDKTLPSKEISDFWIVKINAIGTKLWDSSFGGNNFDILRSLQQTADNGFILGGFSQSNNNGDKSEASKGATDFWVVKLGPEIVGLPETQTTSLTLYPNPTTGIINLELKDQQPTQISVYNSLGQIILTKTDAQPNPDGNLQLDLSNQAKGIYTVQVISGNRSAVKKVVLE